MSLYIVGLGAESFKILVLISGEISGKEVMLRPSGRIEVCAAAERKQRRSPQRSRDQRVRYADRH